MKHEILCTIHNFEFGYNELAPNKPFVECPMCADEALEHAKAKLREVTEQRDLLLKAIELKKTLVPLNRDAVPRPS